MSLNTILATAPLTTTNYILKATGTTIGNSLIWDNGTNVGIGNTNTFYTLDVSGTGRFLTTTNGFITRFTGGTSSSVLAGIFASTAAGFASIGVQSNHGFNIFTNDIDRLCVTSAGNVGIGTSSPNARLSLGTGTGTKFLLYDGGFTGSGGNGYFSGFAIDSPSANDTTLLAHYQGALVFGRYTNANDTSAITERMRITSGGDVCFGKTVYDNSTTGVSIADTKTTAIVSVVTDAGVSILCNRKTSTGDIVVFRYNGSGVGSISTNGSTTSYNITSDYRLKEDLKEINGLEKVCAIKVYDFKWKNSENRMDGVLAHELEQILPYAVNGDKDAIDEDGNIAAQGVDYSKLVPILIKAIQELSKELLDLKEIVATK